MAEPEFAFDVFLSHSSKDKDRVHALAERLRSAGVRVWFDKWVIQPGDDIYLAIERGLEVSRTLILCMSPNTFGSDWVGLERSTALFRDPVNKRRRFLPLLLADCKIPDTLRRYLYIDFQEETDENFRKLLEACFKEDEIHTCLGLSSTEENPAERSSPDSPRIAFQAHPNAKRYFWPILMLLCLAGSAAYKFVYLPSQEVDRLLAMVSRDNKFSGPFFEPQLTDCGNRLEVSPSLFDPVLLSSPGKDCVATNMETLTTAKQPILLLGEPATGKGYLLKHVLSNLNDQGEFAVLINIRHCMQELSQQPTLHDCLEYGLGTKALSELPKEQLKSSTDRLVKSGRLWILIDGIDDPADPKDVVPLLREIGDFARETDRLIVSGRGESLAFIVSLHSSNEVLEPLAVFREIYLDGLSDHGIKEAEIGEIDAIAGLRPEEKERRKRLILILKNMEQCSNENAYLGREILSKVLLLRQWLKTPVKMDENANTMCDRNSTILLRKWLTTWMFDYYCKESLCGNEVETEVLKKAVLQIADILSDLPPDNAVDNSSIESAKQRMKGIIDVPNVKVLRGLFLTGYLHMGPGGQYMIREYRRHLFAEAG